MSSHQTVSVQASREFNSTLHFWHKSFVVWNMQRYPTTVLS